MRIDRGMFGWGVFFVLVGAVPLGVEAGIVSTDAVDSWVSLWPLIIVGIGLGLILRRTPLEALGGVVVAATFGLMVGGALSTGFADVGRLPGSFCGGAEPGTPFETQSGELGGRTTIDLEVDCGELRVGTMPGRAWSVGGTSVTGASPQVDVNSSGLEVHTDDGNAFFDHGANVQVLLPTDASLTLDIAFSAGSLEVDLPDGSIENLSVDLNAGDGRLGLDDVGSLEEIELTVNAGRLVVDLPAVSTSGSIQVNAGNVDLCAPPGVGLRLETGDNVISAYDYDDAGLVEGDGAWQSPGYDTAPVQIDLETRANAGSFSLDGEACDR